MGLFDKRRKKKQAKYLESLDCRSLLEMHDKGQIDDISFLTAFRNTKVFYSTPFGDHKDGGSRLFVLPAKDETAYLPVFTTTGRLMEFYEKAGRLAYVTMENSFKEFLLTTSQVNTGDTPVKLGAIIDPGYFGVIIDAGMLGSVLGVVFDV